jgi:hypothetical protein
LYARLFGRVEVTNRMPEFYTPPRHRGVAGFAQPNAKKAPLPGQRGFFVAFGWAALCLFLGRSGCFFNHAVCGLVYYYGGIAGFAGHICFHAVSGIAHGITGFVSGVFRGSSVVLLLFRARSGGESAESGQHEQRFEGSFHRELRSEENDSALN